TCTYSFESLQLCCEAIDGRRIGRCSPTLGGISVTSDTLQSRQSALPYYSAYPAAAVLRAINSSRCADCFQKLGAVGLDAPLLNFCRRRQHRDVVPVGPIRIEPPAGRAGGPRSEVPPGSLRFKASPVRIKALL